MIPNQLQKGDIIGVIAPSSPVYPSKLEDINNSIILMEQAGFQIQFANHTFSNSLGYSATVQEKAEDIHQMFADSNIKAIFCCTGGFNSNSLFEYLDDKIIQNNPKILCGFSDSTSLLNNIWQKTGLVTFHGSTFKSLTSWETDYGYQEVMKRFVTGDLALGQATDNDHTIQEGVAEGILIGGNLSLMAWMSSGKYAVDFTNKILFIEELGEESEPAMISHCLYHMKQNGVFDAIKGLWLGNYEHLSGITLERIVKDVIANEYDFPIIQSNYFGHTDKKTVIPIGIKAKIDTSKERKIQLQEPCVTGK